MGLAIGTRLGPYEILSAIGAGGMGEVYKAKDTRLDRTVAIKGLPSHVIGDPALRERFDREARTVAALNHPHICTLYDVGRQDGTNYLVMEYLEGETIAQRLEKGALPLDQTLRCAIEIADALDKAHRAGIVHRDLKPGNIMLTKGGAKLLDFGLAKSGAPGMTGADLSALPTTLPNLTAHGTILGTFQYIAPEQAEGGPIDARADVFSFGAVLYEMVSGRCAFRGSSVARVLSAVLRDDPRPLEAPPAIANIVTRCLAKQAAQRFQTMADVRAALEQAVQNSASLNPSIAVLPFANLSADKENEYFSDGLAEEIINVLAHVPGLKVIARTSAFAFRGKDQDIRTIAQTLGVRSVLEGSVRRSGNRIRVTAQLIDAEGGHHLWSERYDREMADVFAIQDDISQAIASALQVALAVRPTHSRHTPKLPAYEAVLKGRHYMLRLTPASLARANDCFEQAMAVDPRYAEAHASLGFSYFMSAMLGLRSLRETMPLIRAEAQEALILDPSDPGPHILLASVAAAYEYDWKVARELFETGMAGPSTSPEAHWAYASLYLQPLGRHDEAVAHMERAVERDPVNAHWRGVLASHLTHARRPDEAIRQANEALEIDEASLAGYVTLGEAYIFMERWEDAAAMLEKGHQRFPQDGLSAGLLAGTLVHLGDHAQADTLIREMGETPRPLIGRALYHMLCSDTDQAADWYERAINARDPFALVFAAGPLGNDFRQSSRWPKLARMMNMPSHD